MSEMSLSHGRSGINFDLLWLLTSYDSHNEIRSQAPINICPVLQRQIISVSSGSINNSKATVPFAADQPLALSVLTSPPPDVRNGQYMLLLTSPPDVAGLVHFAVEERDKILILLQLVQSSCLGFTA